MVLEQPHNNLQLYTTYSTVQYSRPIQRLLLRPLFKPCNLASAQWTLDVEMIISCISIRLALMYGEPMSRRLRMIHIVTTVTRQIRLQHCTVGVPHSAQLKRALMLFVYTMCSDCSVQNALMRKFTIYLCLILTSDLQLVQMYCCPATSFVFYIANTHNARRVCLSVCQPPLAPYLLHGREPRPRRLSPWALGTCPILPPPPPWAAWGGGGWVAGFSFPADFAKSVSLAHRVVFHGGKLPPIGRGASSHDNNADDIQKLIGCITKCRSTKHERHQALKVLRPCIKKVLFN